MFSLKHSPLISQGKVLENCTFPPVHPPMPSAKILSPPNAKDMCFPAGFFLFFNAIENINTLNLLYLTFLDLSFWKDIFLLFL